LDALEGHPKVARDKRESERAPPRLTLQKRIQSPVFFRHFRRFHGTEANLFKTMDKRRLWKLLYSFSRVDNLFVRFI
jgi:hypothetical protein